MTKPYQHWKVLPHGDLCEVDDGILTVVGRIRMPLGNFPRRMTVVRLRDSRLVVWSAIALDDERMARLEDYGRPAFLIVPNDHHRLDAKIWKNRYPRMEVVAPSGSRGKVDEIVHVDSTGPQFGDPDVAFMPVSGTQEHEAALVVRKGGGTTLVLNDVVGNIANARGIFGWFLHLAGFAGKAAKIPRVVRMAMIKDAGALRGQLLQWSEMQSLRRILVSHGDPIEADPRQTLRDLAGSVA